MFRCKIVNKKSSIGELVMKTSQATLGMDFINSEPMGIVIRHRKPSNDEEMMCVDTPKPSPIDMEQVAAGTFLDI